MAETGRRELEAAKVVAAEVAARVAVQVERRARLVWGATRGVAVLQLAVDLGRVDVAAGWADLSRKSRDTWMLPRLLGDLRYWLSFAGAGPGRSAFQVLKRCRAAPSLEPFRRAA